MENGRRYSAEVGYRYRWFNSQEKKLNVSLGKVKPVNIKVSFNVHPWSLRSNYVP